jgi:hypothetical protein
MLMKWITDPAARRPYEIEIRNRFRPMSWSSSAQQFFDVVQRDEPGLQSL